MIQNLRHKTCSTLNLNHVSNIIGIINHHLHHQTFTTNFSSSSLTQYISQTNSLIASHVRRGDPVSAWILFHSLRRARADVDAYTFTSVLRACTLLHVSQLGTQVHAQMVKTGADSGTVAKTSLVDMYSKCGSLDEAVKVFDEMGQRDVVAWNALLSCFLRCDLPVEAVGVLRAMGRENVELSEFTLCSALKSCASLKALELGKQVHGLVVCMGRDMVVLSTALIDFYSSVGCVDDALKVFCSLKGWKDDMMYNSLVSGCVRNRRYGEAFRVMGLVRPNAVALTSALVGCSENLDLEKYGLEPDPEHYACYIDILGRAGNIEGVWTAYHNMVEQGTRPTAGIWVALLNACSLNQDVERGELAAKHLLQLEPNKSSYIVLVSNFYAAIGKWDRVDELRSVMRTKGLVKEAGNSWINVLGLNQHASAYLSTLILLDHWLALDVHRSTSLAVIGLVLQKRHLSSKYSGNFTATVSNKEQPIRKSGAPQFLLYIIRLQ
ncbi:hypothetical protein V8G54_033161 [Vigna mungo]|uniref:Pentatricopeptide repeat-containing protein n=1 Tax=Vigna mungo TaxID=3915 RepID=A0AAQ3MNI8_VIGMU